MLDGIGGLLGVEQFPTTTAGNKALLGWCKTFGTVDQFDHPRYGGGDPAVLRLRSRTDRLVAFLGKAIPDPAWPDREGPPKTAPER